MDNVRTHKVAGVKEAIEAKGASVLYLPRYSPDFNPIEKPFSKIKSILRAHRSADGRSAGGGGRRGVAKLHAARVHELLRLIRLRCRTSGHAPAGAM